MDERLEKQYLHGTKPKFTHFIGTKNICKSNIYIYSVEKENKMYFKLYLENRMKN